MTGQMAAGGGGRDELAVQGRPPLDPSTRLRVSGPSRDGFRLGGRNDGIKGVGRRGKWGVGGLVGSRAVRESPLRGGGASRPTIDPSILPAAADLGCGEGGHEELVSKVAPRPNSRFLATWIRAYGTRRIGQEYPIGLCLTYF